MNETENSDRERRGEQLVGLLRNSGNNAFSGYENAPVINETSQMTQKQIFGHLGIANDRENVFLAHPEAAKVRSVN
jgi:hypothetical protein